MPRPHVLVAAVTPRRELNGTTSVDLEAFARQLARAANAGLDGLLIGGSTGRGDVLRSDELQRMLDSAISVAPELERVAGFGAHELPLAEILERIEVVGDRATSLLIAAPDDDERVLTYFSELVSVSPLPVLVYQPPARRDRPFPATLARELAALEGLAGVKDSTGSLELISAWRSGRPGFRLLLGSLRLFAREAGQVDGAILAYANLDPKLCLALARGEASALDGAEADLKEIEARGLVALEALLSRRDQVGG